jgi:isopenicillin N synthase-like dioxygenase
MNYIQGTPGERNEFVQAFFEGLKDYGFIVLKDHPIDLPLLDRAYELLGAFFSLPEEEKRRYAGITGGQRGYTPFGTEHAKDAAVFDLKEFWHVGREIDSTHHFAKYYPPNVWPSSMPEFRDIFLRIYSELDKVGRLLLEALTGPLNVPVDYFDTIAMDGNSILRLLHYPPVPENVDPRCVRAAAHEDINLITILVAATASGLQLKDRDGTWLDIESDPNSLIIDAGDMLARITNEVIPSTTHRVVNPPNSNSRRFSMPYFMHPHPEALLTCIPSCLGDGAKFPDITAHEFLMERLREIGLIPSPVSPPPRHDEDNLIQL